MNTVVILRSLCFSTAKEDIRKFHFSWNTRCLSPWDKAYKFCNVWFPNITYLQNLHFHVRKGLSCLSGKSLKWSNGVMELKYNEGCKFLWKWKQYHKNYFYNSTDQIIHQSNTCVPPDSCAHKGAVVRHGFPRCTRCSSLRFLYHQFRSSVWLQSSGLQLLF